MNHTNPFKQKTERELLQELVDGIHELIALQRQHSQKPHYSPPPGERSPSPPPGERFPPPPREKYPSPHPPEASAVAPFPSIRHISSHLSFDLRAEIDKSKAAISSLSFGVGYSTTEAITFARKNEWLTELGRGPDGDAPGGWHKGWFVVDHPICLVFSSSDWQTSSDIFIKPNAKDKFVVAIRTSDSTGQVAPERVLNVFKQVCRVVTSGTPALTLADTVDVWVWRFGGGSHESHILSLSYVLNI